MRLRFRTPFEVQWGWSWMLCDKEHSRSCVSPKKGGINWRYKRVVLFIAYEVKERLICTQHRKWWLSGSLLNLDRGMVMITCKFPCFNLCRTPLCVLLGARRLFFQVSLLLYHVCCHRVPELKHCNLSGNSLASTQSVQERGCLRVHGVEVHWQNIAQAPSFLGAYIESYQWTLSEVDGFGVPRNFGDWARQWVCWRSINIGCWGGQAASCEFEGLRRWLICFEGSHEAL